MTCGYSSCPLCEKRIQMLSPNVPMGSDAHTDVCLFIGTEDTKRGCNSFWDVGNTLLCRAGGICRNWTPPVSSARGLFPFLVSKGPPLLSDVPDMLPRLSLLLLELLLGWSWRPLAAGKHRSISRRQELVLAPP